MFSHEFILEISFMQISRCCAYNEKKLSFTDRNCKILPKSKVYIIFFNIVISNFWVLL